MAMYPYDQAKKFQQTFPGMKFQLFYNPLFGFDIIEFDDAYKLKYGDYETSLSDAICARFGEDANKFVSGLLNMRGII